jgi:hypothetical protein
MQERHGTWERTGNTVKMVEDNGYVYWECTYYPERNQIAGRYYSNHKKPDGDITLIPYNEEVARSLQAEERARLAAMSAKNAEEAQRWKWLDSLSQGLQGASGALSQTLLQVPGTNQGQTGTTQIQQTAISLAGTNWRANLGQGKTETIYFSNGTWVSVSGSDSVAGTYTYNGSTETLKTSTGGAVGSGTVSGTTLSMFGNQYTKQ